MSDVITMQEVRQMFLKAVQIAYKITGTDLHLDMWTLDFNTRKSACGLCNYAKRTVYISKHYMYDREQVWNTVLHEVAHAVCPRHNHDDVWRRTFIAMGGNGQTRASVSKPVEYKYYVVNTLTGERVYGYHRKPKWNIAECSLKGKPETRGKLKLVAA